MQPAEIWRLTPFRTHVKSLVTTYAQRHPPGGSRCATLVQSATENKEVLKCMISGEVFNMLRVSPV